MPIVTLLSDFGNRDSYVAQMKGVILGICPSCRIVDVTHEVAPQNVLMGAFLLESTVNYFPRRTVHLAVVDPGVGSERAPLVLKCRQGTLVGPDNGLLVGASRKLGLVASYRIQGPGPRRASLSSTFHGRDIFAVTAGRLAAGLRPGQVGPRVREIVELGIQGAKVERGTLECRVLHVDVFGNVITNADNRSVEKFRAKKGQRLVVRCEGRTLLARYVETYSEIRRGEVAVLRGSQGYVEVAVREGSAAALLRVRPLEGMSIRVSS